MRILNFLPLILALLFVSCIEGEEEIWLEDDGSGRIEASYKMPPLVLTRLGAPDDLVRTLQEAADRDSHVDLTHVSHRSDQGQAIIEFAGTFDDIRNLSTFPKRQLRDPKNPEKPVKLETLFGELDLDITGGEISYERTVDLSSVLPNTIKKAPKILDKSSFHYTLHLPSAASESNATSISKEDRKLEWNFLLKEFVTQPMILTAKGALPRLSRLWLLALLPFAFLIGIFIFRSKRSLSKLEASANS